MNAPPPGGKRGGSTPRPVASAGRRGLWIVAHRRLIGILWLVATAALVPGVMSIGPALKGGDRIPGSESALVQRELLDRFASPFGHYLVVVMTGVESPATESGRAALAAVTTGLVGAPGVQRTLSFLDVRDSLFLPVDGHGTLILVGINFAESAKDRMIGPLRGLTERLADSLHATFPRLTLRWTGDLALDADLRRQSGNEVRLAEERVLPLTIALLIAAFGAIVAAMLPVVVGVMAIALTLGIVAILAQFFPLSALLQNMVTMLGLGLGVDYALLTVSRFREAMGEGSTVEEAAAIAASNAGHTIAISGAAVMIGFVGLMLVPLNEMRSMAVGGLLVVGIAMALAMTLLPGMLVWCGPLLERRRGRRTPRGGDPEDGRWWRWARWVVRHPVLVLLIAVPPVGWLAAQSGRLNTSMPKNDWLPRSMESAQALSDLEAMGHGGIVYALRILIEVPVGTTVMDSAGWRAVSTVSKRIAGDPRVARVRSLPGLVQYGAPNSMLLGMIPSAVRSAFLSTDGRLALIEVQPASGADYQQVTAWVRELRKQGGETLSGLPGVTMQIGGLPAFNADYEDLIRAKLPLVVAFVVVGTLIALLIGFRSVMIPLKAITLNLLAVLASFGAVVVVFQDGVAARLVGLDGAVTGLFPSLPVLVFCIVFGLSMDYEVFLVSRVAEARRLGRDEAAALAEGLARTGGVITSAAAVMVAVFAAFTLGELLLVKVMGFALAAAVLLDATVVRMAIGPALLRLAGRWNWWPGDRMRAAAVAGPDVAIAPVESDEGQPIAGA